MTGAPQPPERRRRRPAISAKARAVLLEALAAGWSVTAAAERAGVNRRRVYDRAERDPDFRAELARAVEAGTDLLEDEARRRAVEGVAEPVFQGGALVGEVQRYSDRLLEFLLAGRRPEKFGRNARLEVGGIAGQPVEVAVEQDWRAVARRLQEAGILELRGPAAVDVPPGEPERLALPPGDPPDPEGS